MYIRSASTLLQAGKLVDQQRRSAPRSWSYSRPYSASGFIGLPAAQALVRAGHIVYGLTRSQEKAQQLAREEIIPVVSQTSDLSTWLPLIASLDVIIEVVGGTADVRELSKTLLNAVASAAQSSRPAHAPKLTYIYTSGTWVHGDDRTAIKTDTSPITAPAQHVAWRAEQEQRVVTNTVLNGIVIRPALLYGRSGSLLVPLFKGAAEGTVMWFGTPEDRYALIRVDDLAELFRLAAEKAQLVGGKIFDAANDITESADDLLKKLVKVSGAQGPHEFVQPSNLYETALTTTSLLRPYLARSLLSWQPRKAGLVDNLEVYYDAWKASVN
ncbi:uncharacterized protein PHACADRAFT_164427 [Phanerochaete carnosa HHB-10118-sp]|uniref:NAD-dependent epimerase/dehydratase domain-containing protein n=1 Tax=Phanerochaete carnosa (strain HHB-10118-sp) TaxID=650164 RepID=K5VM30_PHACS|nr:uncharacterized protein PHACADRAFT_164427 [Phanerochaete carnosa HHB-10118-sp]EKM52493.1 hypothetical protein PHACADRAFT_164427 [Phanerochaete carnosa HHB-10118-sp]